MMSFIFVAICLNLFSALTDANVNRTEIRHLECQKNNEELNVRDVRHPDRDEVLWSGPLSLPTIALQTKDASPTEVEPIRVSFRNIFRADTGPKKNEEAFKRKRRRRRRRKNNSIFPELNLFSRDVEKENSLESNEMDAKTDFFNAAGSTPDASKAPAESAPRQAHEQSSLNASPSEMRVNKVTTDETRTNLGRGYTHDDHGDADGGLIRVFLAKRRKPLRPTSIENLIDYPTQISGMVRKPRKMFNRSLFRHIF